ncbi:DivIVA domain-containing protein [Lacticaseibacillus pabuli]|uniref:DivIVA domain-containing protein n=1 Tax=Lacticaseibacillus pabuli TaxID=3025672 RepID=A0ABY7WR96_9LACO|nr:DivIVA domain-containing protein [Lacticaseibacillus sp. KACC 23028]WDF81665.1 DivIVA domain-containing protein [Lacticaseibacillus sp. KACC 23028]
MLSPMDIRDKSFTVKMRGFDQDQVNDFLDQIIADYESTLNELEDTKKKLKASEDKAQEYEGMKNAMNQAILVAQEAADKLKQQSEEDAAKVQKDAEDNAEKLLSDASEKSNRILSDASEQSRQLAIQTEDLKKNARDFREHLAALLSAELEAVQSNAWTEVLGKRDEAEKTSNSASDSESNAQNSQSPLDSEGADSLNSDSGANVSSETAPQGPEPTDQGVTEIVFPDGPMSK